ncbi:cytochrome P450 [Tengunoibacter tsumagoiensis]|uniref:Putative cytochrome P450 YjiB n=1 Tax=Tengunoibacter tsumagoiensis TaxID=2014871 RepID=A0A402A437_9CHLR|nr:cytochrome P450 [Tengunoibacter tsumagoiensis]GCE13771.1 putative cytochrome P450 YjiB [Tengunoibacter tsumagoiensis]
MLTHKPITNAFDLYSWFTLMRTTNPVTYDEDHHAWNVFSYKDVYQILTDPKTFSSHILPGEGFIETSILMIDPPMHRHYRNLVSQAFTPRRIAQLEPRITEIVDTYLDSVIESGKMDVIQDLSYPLPLVVICEMLGIPMEDRDFFGYWTEIVIAEFAKFQGGDLEAQQKLGAYFLQIADLRRKEPKDDLISALLTAQVDGERLSDRDIQSFCMILLLAGSETTRNLIGNAIYALTEHPEVLAQVQNNLELVPQAIEEVIRYYSPVRFAFRVATSDVILGGQQIKAGQLIFPWIASANRDEHHFTSAEHFTLDRPAQQHVGFGHGIHFCLGAPLARLEARIALTSMLQRLKCLRLSHEEHLEAIVSPSLQGLQKVPVYFQPGTPLR